MIGERLRAIRLANHCTQKTMSQLLNITRTAYSYYESGFRKPSMETLCVIADHFQISLDYLYERTEEADFVPVLDLSEAVLLDRFRSADDRGRDTILNTAYYECCRQKYEELHEKQSEPAAAPRKGNRRNSRPTNT